MKNDTYLLKCPNCNKKIKMILNIESLRHKDGRELSIDRFDYYATMKCPKCYEAIMQIYNDGLDRFKSTLNEFFTDKDPMYFTYTPPKYNGLFAMSRNVPSTVNDIIVDDYTYPSLILTNHDTDKLNRIMVLISNYLLDSIKDFNAIRMSNNLDGSYSIKLDVPEFNSYFVSLKQPIYKFKSISEFYLFDFLNYICNRFDSDIT